MLDETHAASEQPGASQSANGSAGDCSQNYNRSSELNSPFTQPRNPENSDDDYDSSDQDSESSNDEPCRKRRPPFNNYDESDDEADLQFILND